MSKNTPKQLKTGGDGAKLPAKSEKKSLAKDYTPEKIREMIRKDLHITSDPDYILETVTKKVNAYLAASDKEAEAMKKDMMESHSGVLDSMGLDTHYALATTVSERHRSLVITVARQIEKEYNCKTASEKVLIQLIAGTYGKIIGYSSVMNSNIYELSISNEKNGYLAILSKELDRAHRQLITALSTLRQIKNPPIEFNVKAKTAFVAQNQQINAINNPIQQNENIEPK